MLPVNRFLRDERGMETVEYAIVAACIVSGIVAIIFALGGWVSVRFRFLARMLYDT